MTITVTDIVAGPFTGTGAPLSLPYPFKVFTAGEIEVFTRLSGMDTIIDPDLYTVTINRDAFGVVLEGGSVEYSASDGAEIYLRAKPSPNQDQEWSDTGSRLQKLNEGLDRAALRDLVLEQKIGDATGPTDAQVEQLITPIVDDAVSTKAEKDLSDVPEENFGGKEFTAAPAGLAEPVVRSMADRLTQELFVAGQDFALAVDGSTDDQPTLQALSDYARNNSRAIEVILPTTGLCGLGAALSINSNYVTFRAGGAGYSHDVSAPPPFGFVPAGGYSGTALKHASPIGSTNPVIVGGGFKNVSVLGLFDRALHVTSVQLFDSEIYTGPVTGFAAVLFDCLLDYRAGSGLAQLGEAGDNQQFRFRLRGRVTSEGGGNANANALVYSGFTSGPGQVEASGNTSVAHDCRISVRTENGHAFLCDNADEVSVEVRHGSGGTGRGAYIRGNRTDFTAAGFGLGVGVNLPHYNSSKAAYYEGTDTPANNSAASGIVSLDRGNNTPYPLFGTGAKPLVIDAEAIVGAWLRSPIMADDAYTSTVTAAALAGAGAGIGDAGAGALLMRLVSGGLLRWGEENSTTARLASGGGIDKMVFSGLTKGLQADRLHTTNGGLRSTPYEGWAGTIANNELIFEFQQVTPGSAANFRIQGRDSSGQLFAITTPMTLIP